MGMYVFEDSPIEDVVVLKSLADEQVAEEFAQVCVIRFIIKPQRPSIIQENSKLIRKPPAQNLRRSRHLLFHNTIIFLFLGGCLKALPRERSPTEIHHDISQRFEIIATRLLYSEMRVDGGISCCSGEIFVLAVGDVEMCFGVAVFFGETKVDDIHLVTAFANAHEEVVGFDVSVDKGFCVNIFNARDLM